MRAADADAERARELRDEARLEAALEHHAGICDETCTLPGHQTQDDDDCRYCGAPPARQVPTWQVQDDATWVACGQCPACGAEMPT